SPHWASSIYGFLFIAGQLISSMAFMIAVVVLLAGTEPFSHVLQKRHLHDLAKLLLAFVMLWAYFDFSQLLIIWSGNQPEEISFYRTRLYGGWGVVAVLVLVSHFFVPFFLLLSQDVKRNARVLPKIALWLIFMRLVDLFWMTRPEFTARALPSWLDIVLPLALGGLWLGLFAFNLRQDPLLPIGDPNLEEALEHHQHCVSHSRPRYRRGAPRRCFLRGTRRQGRHHLRLSSCLGFGCRRLLARVRLH